MFAKGPPKPPVHFMFGDESGAFKAGDWMVVGVLCLTNPERARTELARLRPRTRFYTEMRYGDTDKYRLPLALDWLNWFASNTDAEFRCIAKDGSTHDPSYYNHRWRGLSADTLAYNYTYKELVSHNVPKTPHRLIVKVDERSRSRHDNLLDYLRDGVPTVVSVTDADSKTDDLLQLADLLTGAVRGALVFGGSGVKYDPIKQALTDQLMRHMGVGAITDAPTKCSREKVGIWRWDPARAKKRAAVRP